MLIFQMVRHEAEEAIHRFVVHHCDPDNNLCSVFVVRNRFLESIRSPMFLERRAGLSTQRNGLRLQRCPAEGD